PRGGRHDVTVRGERKCGEADDEHVGSVDDLEDLHGSSLSAAYTGRGSAHARGASGSIEEDACRPAGGSASTRGAGTRSGRRSSSSAPLSAVARSATPSPSG